MEEALTNIRKHSNANQVQIQLSIKSQTLPKGNSELHLEIEDNGQGFNPAENFTGFGLRGMKERAESVGGSLELISHPEFGCRILAIFPLIGIFYD